MSKVEELEMKLNVLPSLIGHVTLTTEDFRKLLAAVKAAQVHAEGPHNGNNLELLRHALAALEGDK